jgi:hypothetical protein
MRGNSPVRFGKGPTEKDPSHGHLAGGLFHSAGGRWKRAYDVADRVPIKGVVPEGWIEAITDTEGRIERVSYELCVLVSLADALRRREIYVAGAVRWRNPEADLPVDFEDNRDVHYHDLRQPLDAGEFIAGLKGLMRQRTAELAKAIEKNRSGGVKLKTVRGEPRWHVPELGKLPVPANLQALHAEVARRWGTIDLLDFLKETDYPHRLHQRVLFRRHARDDAAASDPQTAAVGIAQPGDQYRDQEDRRRR